MSYIVLARKWRPKRFADMVGQEHVLRALSNALDSGKVHHAFLFTGTRGVGKTTVARILAKSLNCERGVSANPCGICAACREIDEGRFVDLIEVDAASRTKVDDTRELLDNVQYAPTRGRYKVYLIDEVHMLSNHSFNALLKTFEEPPPHVKFLLATTDPQKLPVTVLSRCLQFSLKRLPAGLIAERMKSIATAEKLELEPAAASLLGRAADGSMRDGLSLMDQLIAFAGGKLTEANTRSMLGTIDRGHLARILDAVSQEDGPGVLLHARELDRDAPDYDGVLVELAAFLQRVAVVQVIPDAADQDEEFDAEALGRLASALSPEDVQLYYQIVLGGRRDLNLAPEPRVGFEMVLLRMLAFRPESSAVNPVAASAVPRAAPRMPGSDPGVSTIPVSPTPKPQAAQAIDAGAREYTGVHSGDSTTDRINAGNWTATVEAAGMSGMVRQFALNCIPGSFEQDTLRLLYDHTAEHRRTRQIEDKLSQCLTTYLGAEVRVIYETADASAVTPARKRAIAEQDRTLRAAAAFGEDLTVKNLRERFGAEIDAASVKPTN